jgi:hypothetical protein
VTCSKADCPFNSVQSVQGDCFTTNVYEQGRWWLCESHFNGARTLSVTTNIAGRAAATAR